MANQKLSRTPGYTNSAEAIDALSASSWITDHDFTQIDEEAWMPNQQSGETYHDHQAKFTTTSSLTQDYSYGPAASETDLTEESLWFQTDTGHASDVVQCSNNLRAHRDRAMRPTSCPRQCR